MVLSESGNKRELDDVSIDVRPQPRASDWLWRPWYAKLWWSAVPVYWIGAAASVKIDPLAAFYDTAFAGYCNMLFFPMTALLVLGVGFARAWIDVRPGGDRLARPSDSHLCSERQFGDPHWSVDHLSPWSGSNWIGSPLNPLNTIQRHSDC